MMIIIGKIILINFRNKFIILAGALLVLSAVNTASAGDVTIVAAEFTNTGEREWSVNVTLEHADSGWDHYADNWRVVDADGNVLGDRVLYHPHVEEQPFTRNLGGVEIPEGMTEVYITAHDTVHSWTEDRLLIDLEKAEDGALKVLGSEAEASPINSPQDESN